MLVWLLNLYNFMDGIDGIAAAETVSVAGSAAVLLMAAGEWEIAVWLACLAFSSAGFLFWNWPPARIFMGDVGSGFLGYELGVCALLTASAGWLSIWTWIILLGAFLTDASVTVLRRMLRGDRWYAAHRSHAYQHAARRWGGHRKVTLAVIIVDLAWLLPLAVLSESFPHAAPWLVLVAILPLAGLALALGAGKAAEPSVG
jgi:Fuc2NAc and GlcNAc transferase